MPQRPLHLHLAGPSCPAFAIIREMNPLASFTYAFSEKESFDESFSTADLLLANLEGQDVTATLPLILAKKKSDAHVILLLSRGQAQGFFTGQAPEGVDDVWIMPLSEEEAQFRFLQWQAVCKARQDSRRKGRPSAPDAVRDSLLSSMEWKKKERRHRELIQALSTDFSLVCFVDPDRGTMSPIRGDYLKAESIFDREVPMREHMERYINDRVHEDDREMMRSALSLETLLRELSTKRSYYVNYRRAINGESTYYQVKAAGAKTVDGGLGIVLGFRSIDEETRREIEQKRLLEAALFQANQANSAKSAFLSNMSHDIRTPMNAIVGFTNLAIAHIDNQAQVAGYLQKIEASGSHLLNLINDVLDMSHIESGKIQLEEKPCSLPGLLRALESILQADVQTKELTLRVDSSGISDEEIYCDRLRLNQVLLNLLGNAVKYTNVGGMITLRLTQSANPAPGLANYEFSIRDNGIGMSPEFIERIFEPFEREKNSTISGIQGTGLGMAITRNLVEMMGGSIRVQSKQGEGSEFLVSFPFRLYAKDRSSEQSADLRNAASEKKAAEGALSGKNIHRSGRILLAEDVELNQEIAVAILGDAGFTTEVAPNGLEAVNMVKAASPGYYRAVLMDVQMPVMDGYQATREIRKLPDPAQAAIPIIAMTANAFEEDKQKALESGMNGHIAKPIDIPNLFSVLDGIL